MNEQTLAAMTENERVAWITNIIKRKSAAIKDLSREDPDGDRATGIMEVIAALQKDEDLYFNYKRFLHEG